MTTDTSTPNLLTTPLPPAKEEIPPFPYGRTSPRSPLECDLLGHPPTPKSAKKAVLISCSPPIHIDDDVVVGPLAPPSKPRKVSFSKTVVYHEVRHIRDFSPEEIGSLWMTIRDYQFIKAVVKSTVLMMMKGECISEDDPDVCTRGLEFRTKAGARFRNRNKIAARCAVLNEQDMQREEGFFDPRYIAMVSEEASQACREGAYARAMYDERCIQNYLGDARAPSYKFRKT